MSLRVLTLNCWNVSEPFEARMTLIRAGIAAADPDLIGLQEIIVRRDGFDQAAQILEELGYHWAFGAAFRFGDTADTQPHDAPGDGFGNVVASRWPLREVEVRALPGQETGERRSAIATFVEAPHGPIPFVSTHLNWKLHHGFVRERQALALADFVAERSKGIEFPPIVVGDLNADPDSNEVRFLCGLAALEGRSAYLQDAWRVAGDGGPGYTWDNRNPYAALNFEPNRRIDYVLVGQARLSGQGFVEAAQIAMDRSRDGVFPSDHFGLLATVRT
jgi:endonuclease/exonuclease/phosphatase family metal-dependent hydrolase